MHRACSAWQVYCRCARALMVCSAVQHRAILYFAEPSATQRSRQRCLPTLRQPARVQPDQGTLCAYWLAVLVSSLDVDKSSVEFSIYALRALQATVFVHTGHAVPKPLRASLVAALLKMHNRIASGRAKGGTLAHRAARGLQALGWLLQGEDAFRGQVRRVTS
jgi:hypothetical protein